MTKLSTLTRWPLSWKAWQMFVGLILLAWRIPSPYNEVSKLLLYALGIVWLFGIGMHGHRTVIALGMRPRPTQWFLTCFRVALVCGLPLFVLLSWQLHLRDPGQGISTVMEAFDRQQESPWARLAYTALSLPTFLSVVYMAWFDLRMLALLEEGKENGRAFWINTFQMVYFPVGIWWLQPKVNRLAPSAQ